MRLKLNFLRLRPLVSRRAVTSSADDSGFALVIVLGLMVLLAVVSAILAGSVKAHIREASRYAATAYAETLAESGHFVPDRKIGRRRGSSTAPK